MACGRYIRVARGHPGSPGPAAKFGVALYAGANSRENWGWGHLAGGMGPPRICRGGVVSFRGKMGRFGRNGLVGFHREWEVLCRPACLQSAEQSLLQWDRPWIGLNYVAGDVLALIPEL